MAEPDLSSSPARVDLPELSLERGPGDLADEEFQMADETKLELLGPQDESHLPCSFDLDIYSYQEVEDTDTSNSVFADDESEAQQMHSHHEIEDYFADVKPSLLDLLPVQYGRRGRTKCRKKRTSCWAEVRHLFGLLIPSAACRATTFGGRKEIKRWTSDEAKKLVKGVSDCGVGNWTEVKRAYFKTSIRKPVHLKDKWRDFVRACGIQVGSKKEVQPHRATLEIIEGLEEEIQSIYRKHATLNRRAY